jgi:hypothetical protein
MPQRVSKTIYLWPAESHASRIALGTVPGTVPGVVRKVTSEAFPAATCGWILVVTGSGTCGPARNEVRGTSRTASRCLTRRRRGKAVAVATRRENVGVVRGGTSDANLRATCAMKASGLGTRKTGDSPDGRQMGTVPRSACVGRARGTVGTSSAVQSPFGRDSPLLSGPIAPARAEAGPRPGFCELGSSS